MRAPLILSWILIPAMVVASVWAWYAAPQIQEIAVQWGMNGEPVAFRSKLVALSTMPALALALSLLAALWLVTGGSNLSSRRAKIVRAAWSAGLLALALVHIFVVLSASGLAVSFGNYTALGPAVFLAVAGNYIAKRDAGAAPVSPAQRWMGRLLVLTGIATFVAWLAAPGVAAEFVLIGGALLASVVAGIVASSQTRAPRGNGT